MSTSTRAPRHVWTKEEKGTLAECLMELVSMGGWKSDNGAFRPVVSCSEGTPKQTVSVLRRTYVFSHDRVMGRLIETFADVASNEPGGYEGFDMSDGNKEFLSVYNQGKIDMSQDNVRGSQPSRASEGKTRSSVSKRKKGS
ncbi:retrotransposon protein [Cucumis melo var. makuwa]|uniref:Retrotransposon protein n=1 Tax=Cucumis melo var. makuwa TaxID=1194695 RepID=A0A5D3D556_CUCMM|nr:retrotransposon protein [Cucumis melo var. makuwa]TYK18664.1 retrotransposon protein [Cucumis melo var. makuwa]